jgi:acetyltransferase-like isoleucine patch superfamily enzyme
MKSLDRFLWLRNGLVNVKRLYYTKIWGMDLDPTCMFALSVRFDKTYPRGMHVGMETFIAFDAALLSHDFTRGLFLHTRIGQHCFIGARSIILPGITIGDESVVAAGSIVTKDVPPRSLVAGNPAKVISSDIEVGPYGRFTIANANEKRLADAGAFS